MRTGVVYGAPAKSRQFMWNGRQVMSRAGASGMWRYHFLDKEMIDVLIEKGLMKPTGGIARGSYKPKVDEVFHDAHTLYYKLVMKHGSLITMQYDGRAGAWNYFARASWLIDRLQIGKLSRVKNTSFWEKRK